MKINRIIHILVAIPFSLLLLTACRSDADKALAQGYSQCKKYGASPSVCKCYVNGLLDHYGEGVIAGTLDGVIPYDFISKANGIKETCTNPGAALAPAQRAPSSPEILGDPLLFASESPYKQSEIEQHSTEPELEAFERPTRMDEIEEMEQSHASLEDSAPHQPAMLSDPEKPTPSFDCRKASTPTEKAICSDADLAQLDKSLSVAFKSARNNWAGVLEDQRLWIRERDRECGSDPACLRAYMTERIDVLQRI